jgi:hypothetical protein
MRKIDVTMYELAREDLALLPEGFSLVVYDPIFSEWREHVVNLEFFQWLKGARKDLVYLSFTDGSANN